MQDAGLNGPEFFSSTALLMFLRVSESAPQNHHENRLVKVKNIYINTKNSNHEKQKKRFKIQTHEDFHKHSTDLQTTRSAKTTGRFVENDNDDTQVRLPMNRQWKNNLSQKEISFFSCLLLSILSNSPINYCRCKAVQHQVLEKGELPN